MRRHRPSRGWHPRWLPEPLPSELGEWLAFAVLREPEGEASLRSLLESYDLFACCEGHAAIPELVFVRHLERLRLKRRGATFVGLRVHCAVHPLRLLTRLELYGFRFATRDDELVWRGPEFVTDLERRVIARHGHELVAALKMIEETREILRGRSPAQRPSPPARIVRRAAA
jgi:hypothetical protein